MPAARPQPAPPPASAGGDDAAAHPGHGAPAPQRRSRSARSSEGSSRRSELIAIAARSFRVKGFDATTTRDIASASGMQSGSPFYHFKSKGALLYAVMEAGMRAAIERQGTALKAAALQKSEQIGQDPRGLLAVLIQNHFDVLLGPGSDFIPVMLYESRAITARQRATLATLQGEYEAPWVPVLQALHDAGQLRADVKLARLLIFGALNWSVQWFDRRKGATVDELAAAALALFVQEKP